MPGEAGADIPSSLPDGAVYEAVSDFSELTEDGSREHPSHRAAWNRFRATVGMALISVVAVACNSLTPEQTIQQAATQVAGNPERAALISDAIAYHTVRLEKVGVKSVGVGGVSSQDGLGMGVIVNETRGPDGSVTDTMATVDHVLFTGVQLAQLNIYNAFGKWLPKFIDDSLPAGIDWSIVRIPKPDPDPTKNDGITVFSITHAGDGAESLTNGTTLEVNTNTLQEGDAVFFTQAVRATNYNAYITTSSIKSVIIDQSGQTVYLVDTPTIPGDSGTPVFNEQGQLVGFVLGSPEGFPMQTVVVKMTQQALDEAFGGQ